MAECDQTVLTRRLPLIDHLTSVALGEMELAQGRPDFGLRHLHPVAARGFGMADPLMRLHAVPAFVEASIRCGQRVEAAEALDSFQRWFAAADSAPNLAILAHLHGLFANDAAAGDAHFENALRLHGKCERPFDHARTALSYGESLRRRRAKREAEGTCAWLWRCSSAKEIAAQLFLSPRTIDAHLRSIFSKLGIASRSDLRDVDLGGRL